MLFLCRFVKVSSFSFLPPNVVLEPRRRKSTARPFFTKYLRNISAECRGKVVSEYSPKIDIPKEPLIRIVTVITHLLGVFHLCRPSTGCVAESKKEQMEVRGERSVFENSPDQTQLHFFVDRCTFFSSREIRLGPGLGSMTGLAPKQRSS